MQGLRQFRAALGVLALVLIASAACATPANGERLIERTVPASGIQELAVRAHVGKIDIRTTTADQVVLRLRIKSKSYRSWLFTSREGDPDRAELRSETRGATLAFDLRYDGDPDGLEEHWEFQVPARLAARLNLSVGDIDVRGLSGGLTLKLNVGDITADISAGDVTADVNVGSIKVSTATNSYGLVRLEANVGGTRIDGAGSARIRRSRRFGPGDSASLDGDGHDRIRLEVNVGDASLHLRPAQ